eukprot:XP_001708915.1 Hypothetical protein GL50803_35389 [Giardia lamblia ATCC 50803]
MNTIGVAVTSCCNEGCLGLHVRYLLFVSYQIVDDIELPIAGCIRQTGAAFEVLSLFQMGQQHSDRLKRSHASSQDKGVLPIPKSVVTLRGNFDQKGTYLGVVVERSNHQRIMSFVVDNPCLDRGQHFGELNVIKLCCLHQPCLSCSVTRTVKDPIGIIDRLVILVSDGVKPVHLCRDLHGLKF